MKSIFVILSFLTVLYPQDRSTLFSTGNPPNLGEGWDIRCTEFSDQNSLGDVNDDNNIDILDVVLMVNFILETTEPSENEFIESDINLDGQVNILDVVIIVDTILGGNSSECIGATSAAVQFSTMQEYTFEAFSIIFETGDLLGNGILEARLHHDDANSPGEVIGSWQVELDPNIAKEYYTFTGDTDCIILTPMSIYWLSVHPVNSTDQALWLYSEDDFTYSTSDDLGGNWSAPMLDTVGCTKIFAEQIFEPSDAGPNDELVYDWALEDINPNSEYYTQDIGPSTFINNEHVSVYYFGKAG